MRRLVIFLGVFSILMLTLLGVSSALVFAGVIRSVGHQVMGLATVPIVGAYLVLSLRQILRSRRG